MKSAELAFTAAVYSAWFYGMTGCCNKEESKVWEEEKGEGCPQLAVEQPSAHSSPTCSTLFLDDSCICNLFFFCNSSFLILQVDADFFFFCKDRSQVWVKEKVGGTRVGAFDLDTPRVSSTCWHSSSVSEMDFRMHRNKNRKLGQQSLAVILLWCSTVTLYLHNVKNFLEQKCLNRLSKYFCNSAKEDAYYSPGHVLTVTLKNGWTLTWILLGPTTLDHYRAEDHFYMTLD